MIRRSFAVLLLVPACSGTTTPTALVSPTSTTPAATAASTPGPTRTVVASKAPAPRRTASPSASPTPSPPPLCPRVPDVGSAKQVVLVVASGARATARACELRGGRWVSVLGRMPGHVGFKGVASPGAKREGDLRTPSGVFALGRGFGVRADPGVRFGWRRATRDDVWVDDPGSALYNTWQQLPANGRWDSAESLHQPLDYAYAQVVDYNTARVPGRGSAIFLHVDDGNPTLGCITVPQSQLLEVFRWERPGTVIVIR